MLNLTNPRTEADCPNWPSGRRRVHAKFWCETNNRGTRVNRVTTGKPARTNYYLKALIVDGDDGRTYIIAHTRYNQMVLISGTLKDIQYFYSDESKEMYEQIRGLLYN